MDSRFPFTRWNLTSCCDRCVKFSVRGLAVFVLLLPAMVWMIFDEEKFLKKKLPGYAEYMHKVHYRLVPYVW